MKKCYGPLHKGEEIEEGKFGVNQPVCKACKSKYAKDRYARKAEQIKADNRTYKRDNRAKMTEYQVSVFMAKPVNRIWARAKERVANSTKFVERHFSDYKEVLACDRETLLTYLQFLYKPGMTDDNFGKVWEMDHIAPIASFDLTTKAGQFAAFNYMNLQPLWVRENREKGDSLNWKNANHH